MVDVHSHILPNVDDGSGSAEESIALLKLLKQQGVTVSVATPHFYAVRHRLSEFLERRDKAAKMLSEVREDDIPAVRLGAEVSYFEGISRSSEIKELMIEGTPLLLLEMPEETWSGRTADEVLRMSDGFGTVVLLAHVERCLPFQKKQVIGRLIDGGVMMQMNADSFLERGTRRFALKMMKERKVHMIGSDCHNMSSRRPRLDEAFAEIRRCCGDDAAAWLGAVEDDFFATEAIT
ncbi:MAG: capsular polysaccharide biosynthesis protein [Oscillospiraceae bacterium]|nr:capsular polysaccharide biosynthesis protein [Oscillospiraceae bacterium]